TPSRRRIFTCRPAAPSEEAACAGQIVKRLGTQAFRRPLTDSDFKGLMRLYDEGRAERNFEYGIASSIEAMLASPQFVFRLEPAASRSAEASRSKRSERGRSEREASAERINRIGDVELASRLSFFLWDSAPDDELIARASRGRLTGGAQNG